MNTHVSGLAKHVHITAGG